MPVFVQVLLAAIDELDLVLHPCLEDTVEHGHKSLNFLPKLGQHLVHKGQVK